MGYLYDHLTWGQSTADCPALYVYGMVVEYALKDPFMYPKPDDALGLRIKEFLPDVEDWQFSVIRSGTVTFRFHRTADRDTAKNALSGIRPEIRITRIAYLNPPDQVDRGEVDQ